MKFSEAKKDHYRKLAKEQGYRSRAAFKLIQMNNCYHILQTGSNVIDLGCAPGGWLQVAKKVCRGKIMGVDLKEVEPVADAILLQGNIEDQATVNKIIKILNGMADVVLSDLASEVSGTWGHVHAAQISLSLNALRIAKKVLRKDGSAIFKVFDGYLLNEFIGKLQNNFERVILTKPVASRRQSKELYAVCLNFKLQNSKV